MESTKRYLASNTSILDKMNSFKQFIVENYGLSEVVDKVAKLIFSKIKNKTKGKFVIKNPYTNEWGIKQILVIVKEDVASKYIVNKSDLNQAVIQVIPDRDKSLFYSSLKHELKHAYESYLRLSKGHEPVPESKYYSEGLHDIIYNTSKNVQKRYWGIMPLLRAYYHLTDFEIRANIENILESNPLTDTFVKYIKYAKDFKKENYLNTLPKSRLEMYFKNLKEDKIPFFNKFKTLDEFLSYTEKLFNKKGLDTWKKILKIKALT